MQSKFSKVFCPPQTQSGQIVNFQHLEVIHTTWRKVSDLDKVFSALRCHRTAWEQCQFLKCRYQFTYARCRDIQTLHVHIMVLVDLCCWSSVLASRLFLVLHFFSTTFLQAVYFTFTLMRTVSSWNTGKSCYRSEVHGRKTTLHLPFQTI